MVTETENGNSECNTLGHLLQALVPLFRSDNHNSPTKKIYQKQTGKIEEEKKKRLLEM